MSALSTVTTLTTPSTIQKSSKPQQRLPLLESFRRTYKVLKADSRALKDQCYSLRYQVYCEDYGFESSENFPDMKEVDEFDSMSEHFLVQHRATGDFLGTVRLINTVKNGQTGELPIEKYCEHSFTGGITPCKFTAGSYAEISRLAVKKPDSIYSDNSFPSIMKAQYGYSLTTLALSYCCLARFSTSSRLENCFTMMEPRLAVLLSRLGIMFEQVGDVIDYHGKRAPFYWKRSNKHLALCEEKTNFLNYIIEEI